MASRATVGPEPPSIMETIIPASSTVTAPARMREPKGSPTHNATVSARCTAAKTQPSSAAATITAGVALPTSITPRPIRGKAHTHQGMGPWVAWLAAMVRVSSGARQA